MIDRNRFESDEAYNLYLYLVNNYGVCHISIEKDAVLTYEALEELKTFIERTKKHKLN